MAPHQQAGDGPGLAAKLWRGWAIVSLVWVIGSLALLYVRWDDVVPVHPVYVIAPDQTSGKLVAWYSTDEGRQADQFKADRAMPDAEEIPLGYNILVLPHDLKPAQRQDLMSRARALERVLLHRFYRGVAMRFFPLLVLAILGPPVLLLFLGRGLRSILMHFVGIR